MSEIADITALWAQYENEWCVILLLQINLYSETTAELLCKIMIWYIQGLLLESIEYYTISMYEITAVALTIVSLDKHCSRAQFQHKCHCS